MKRFAEWLNESLEQGMEEALNFILGFILSGRKKEVELSTQAQAWLKKTVKGDLVLYRGNYLMNNRVPKELYDDYNSLKVGDVLPAKLQSTLIKPYTKKESVAKAYAKEGNLIFIVQCKVPISNIVADLEQIPALLKGVNQDILDDSDLKYTKKDKEVMVREPVQNAIITMKQGFLK